MFEIQSSWWILAVTKKVIGDHRKNAIGRYKKNDWRLQKKMNVD
jgi:hypothetical protein